jgi:2-dehydro-3-deoxyphosphogluconate aldolase/(4S)-4-hydroxy-2-oxoglutarate aldolase
MASARRIEVYQRIIDSGLVPLYYHPDIDIIKKAVIACVEGGSKIFEFTNRGDGAFRVFEALNAFCRKEFPSLILGVGSVVDQGTAALYINSGTDFVVGSLFNPEIAKLCNRRKIGYIPGCATATEIANAEELGVEIIKIFPGSTIGGPKFVKSILAPTPWSLIIPTGGVSADRENLAGWFKAGVCAVGMGSALFPKESVEEGDFGPTKDLVKKVLTWITAIREEIHA